MSAKAATVSVDARPATRRPGPTAHPPWKPGQSGNPAGRPKRFGELQALAQANFGLANSRLSQLIQSENEETAKWAVGFTFAYILGKPPEGRELMHWETMRARLTELVAVPSEVEEVRKALAGSPLAPEQALPAPIATSEAVTPPEAPHPASGVVREPSGLRCIFHTKDGQCPEPAVEGASWCEPHKAKLFGMVNG